MHSAKDSFLKAFSHLCILRRTCDTICFPNIYQITCLSQTFVLLDWLQIIFVSRQISQKLNASVERWIYKEDKRRINLRPFIHMKCFKMDGSLGRNTPEELLFSLIAVTVYFIWGVVFLLLVIGLCLVGLVALTNNQGYGY